MYLGDIYTISVNLAGLPALSLPCGLDAKGLPIGVQLIGDCFKEKEIIRAAYAVEKTINWKKLDYRQGKRPADENELDAAVAAGRGESAGARLRGGKRV